jgi:hypothetical protein
MTWRTDEIAHRFVCLSVIGHVGRAGHGEHALHQRSYQRKHYAWNICCTLTVADSFIPVSATWVIASTLPDFLGGTVVASGSANFTNSLYCSVCGLGVFDIYTSTISGLNVSLGAGTYYLELRNGLTTFGPNASFFWDENDGPSTAYEDPFFLGGIGSQSFNIYGSGGTTTPEPGTLMLLGSGVAGLAGLLRRKIKL